MRVEALVVELARAVEDRVVRHIVVRPEAIATVIRRLRNLGRGVDPRVIAPLLTLPAMLGVLIVFRMGTIAFPERLPRPFGAVLLLVYVIAVALCFKVLVST